MKTDGIDAVYLTTHNWGKAARFFRSLGFELEFETDHNSGQFRGASGPAIFIAEFPRGKSRWGTRDMTVRDPDGRMWRLQAPGSGATSAHHE